MNEYDIGKAFAAIEEELIASMMRNMQYHRDWEDAEGFNWSMWQAEQLKALNKYKRKNKKKFQKPFQEINASISQVIEQARKQGSMDQELEILEAIKQGWKAPKKLNKSVQTSAEFFKLNTRKLDSLIRATEHDFKKTETAMLRRANDQYRQVIFNAQVYANTGAGTYEKAVDMATHDFLAAGINCIEYKNGARHTMKDYADMAIRTATKRAYLTGEGEKRQEWGISTVIMNKRGNPCPKCLPFVGKIMIDDVWSGGKASDGPYPLMSSAIAAGLYHPRCKDSHSTYFPGVSGRADSKYSKRELAQIEKANEEDAKRQYAQRQVDKSERLEKHSLDNENQSKAERRHTQWTQKQLSLETAPQKPTEFSREQYGELKSRENELQKQIDSLEALRSEQEKAFLTKMDTDAFEKSGEYAAQIDALKENLKPIREEKRILQGFHANEVEVYLQNAGVAEKVSLSDKMTVEAVDIVQETMKELVVDRNLPPLKRIKYDPAGIKARSGTDVVAQYGWGEETMYLGGLLNDPDAFIAHRKKSEELFRKNQSNLEGRRRSWLKEAEEKLNASTDTAKKYLLKKDINEYQAHLNSMKRAVIEDSRDVLIHEYGHHIHNLASKPDPGKKFSIFGKKELKARMFNKQAIWQDDMRGKVVASKVSDYAAESPMEAFAESFTAYMKGERLPVELDKVVEGAIDTSFKKNPQIGRNGVKRWNGNGIGSIIKNIDIDDMEMAAYGKDIDHKVIQTIYDTLKSGERNGDYFISEVVVKSIASSDGGTILLQIEPIPAGKIAALRLNINQDAFAGKTVEEINQWIAASNRSLITNIEEAVIHERGHAKTISGLNTNEIEGLYRELQGNGIEGISQIAVEDGAEAIAEIEVLLSRNAVISKEAKALYEKYVGRAEL